MGIESSLASHDLTMQLKLLRGIDTYRHRTERLHR